VSEVKRALFYCKTFLHFNSFSYFGKVNEVSARYYSKTSLKYIVNFSSGGNFMS